MHDNREEVLVVHLGGLGDVCLAESVFLSLARHFGHRLAALGNRRFLDLFGTYFMKTYGVESRHWLYLFSDKLTGPRWGRIVFIGKDRQGAIRKRWASYSREDVVFIDMYPEGSFPDPEEADALPHEDLHIEEYQLRQLGAFGIEHSKAQILTGNPGPVILYPERGSTKEKWPPENFLILRDRLEGEGMRTVVLKPAALDLPGEGIVIQELIEIRKFFGQGGIFVSNDSGMAHLAGACGLQTITIFTDFNPAVWHPRGRNISFKQGIDDVDPAAIARIIKAIALS